MLQAGQKHRIELEYFEATGLASVKLEGSSKRQAREVIHPSALQHPSALADTGILRGKGRHFITEADFRQMRALGINLVRLLFYDRFFESDAAPGVYRPEAFALLDRTLEAAARQGVYVILDCHGAPGRAEWKRHDR